MIVIDYLKKLGDVITGKSSFDLQGWIMQKELEILKRFASKKDWQNAIDTRFIHFMDALGQLSLSYHQQKAVRGYGAIASEMCSNFQIEYLPNIYLSKGLLNQEQVEKLDMIRSIIKEQYQTYELNNFWFWSTKIPPEHPDWVLIRKTANQVLQSLGHKYEPNYNPNIVVYFGPNTET